jgi:DNA-directed RNA polymerase specialized sigma subunit
MKENSFKKIESQLIKYYSKDKIINSLNEKLSILDRQIKTIDNDLKNCNISIDIESSSPSFEQKVQTSPNGISYAEREVMKITELQIKRKIEKQLEKERVLDQLDNIEIEANEIEWKIKDFTGELKKILEYLYKDMLSENAIAEKMHLSQSQVNRRKQQVIRIIYMWNGWGKMCIKDG